MYSVLLEFFLFNFPSLTVNVIDEPSIRVATVRENRMLYCCLFSNIYLHISLSIISCHIYYNVISGLLYYIYLKIIKTKEITKFFQKYIENM